MPKGAGKAANIYVRISRVEKTYQKTMKEKIELATKTISENIIENKDAFFFINAVKRGSINADIIEKSGIMAAITVT